MTPAQPPATVAASRVEEARRWYAVGASLSSNPLWTSYDARIDHRFYLLVEAASIALDAAQAHPPYGGPTDRQRGVVEDGAALAVRLGVAWG